MPWHIDSIRNGSVDSCKRINIQSPTTGGCNGAKRHKATWKLKKMTENLSIHARRRLQLLLLLSQCLWSLSDRNPLRICGRLDSTNMTVAVQPASSSAQRTGTARMYGMLSWYSSKIYDSMKNADWHVLACLLALRNCTACLRRTRDISRRQCTLCVTCNLQQRVSPCERCVWYCGFESGLLKPRRCRQQVAEDLGTNTCTLLLYLERV